MPVIEDEEIKKQIQLLVDKGFIQPSSSPCGDYVVILEP